MRCTVYGKIKLNKHTNNGNNASNHLESVWIYRGEKGRMG